MQTVGFLCLSLSLTAVSHLVESTPVEHRISLVQTNKYFVGAAAKQNNDGTADAVLDDEQPLTVFFTGTLGEREFVEWNKNFVPPGTEFRYYNDTGMYRSAKFLAARLGEAGVPGAWDAFRMLRPMAFRKDLWSYMILWARGGLYLDSKMRLSTHVKSWAHLRATGAVFCRDADQRNLKGYWNGFMYWRARHPALLHVIKHVISNIEAHQDAVPSRMELCITGPGALRDGLISYSSMVSRDSPYPVCQLSPEAQKQSWQKRLPNGELLGVEADSTIILGQQYVLPNAKTGTIIRRQDAVIAMSNAEIHERQRSGSDGLLTYSFLWKSGLTYCDNRGYKLQYSLYNTYGTQAVNSMYEAMERLCSEVQDIKEPSAEESSRSVLV